MGNAVFSLFTVYYFNPYTVVFATREMSKDIFRGKEIDNLFITGGLIVILKECS